MLFLTRNFLYTTLSFQEVITDFFLLPSFHEVYITIFSIIFWFPEEDLEEMKTKRQNFEERILIDKLANLD
jgi:hypothetical protein